MRRHGERGASVVEFALAATALLLFVFGTLEFGRAIYDYHTIANAARQGARWAIVRGGSCAAPLDHCQAVSSDVQTYVRSQIVSFMDPTQVTVTATWPGDGTTKCPAGSNARGCPVSVQVQYNFGFAVPIIGSGTIPLASTSQMVIAN
jgi:Flp pilus assembly protein TadG